MRVVSHTVERIVISHRPVLAWLVGRGTTRGWTRLHDCPVHHETVVVRQPDAAARFRRAEFTRTDTASRRAEDGPGTDRVTVERRCLIGRKSISLTLAKVTDAEVIEIRNRKPFGYDFVLVLKDGSKIHLVGGSESRSGKERATWAIRRFLAFSGQGA